MAVHYHYNKFPPSQINWQKMIPLLGPANAALARYDGSLIAIPNPAVLLSPLTTREAVLSSRIEGTQATMGEVLEYEAESDGKGFSDDWTGWCEFFLKAIMAQAIENQQKTADILDLYERKKTEVLDLTHSQYAIHALDFLFAHPFFKSTDFSNKEEIPTPTAKRIITALRSQGILRTIREASGRRPAIYAFEELIEITDR